MDIDKLQRINNLARELMKHGMASSMDDAVRLAEEKIKGTPEVSSIRSTLEGDDLSKSQVEKNEVPSERSKEESHNNPSEIAELKKVVSQQSEMINAINTKINELIQGFNEIQEEVKRIKTINIPETKPEEKEAQSQIRSTNNKKKEPHARSGRYSPEDVAVDKIFYSGTR